MATEAEVAFDPTGATPVSQSAGESFDPSGATPIGPSATTTPTGATVPPSRATKPPQPLEALPFMDRVHLETADTAEERELYLQNRYGKSNVKWEFVPTGEKRPGEVAPAGQWRLVTTIKGKRYSDEGGLMPALVSDAPTMTGATGGAMVGAQIGALGGPLDPLTIPLGGVIGAGIGGMLGKGATEAGKAMEGNSTATPLEGVSRAATAGLESMGGEAAGRMISRAGSRLTRGPLPQFVTDTTPESRAMTERTLAGGARPPAQSTMPGARKLQRIEIIANKLSSEKGSGQYQANKQYLVNRMKAILVKAGIPAKHTDAVMQELESPTAAMNTKRLGAEVQDAVRAHVSMLEKGVDDAVDKARKAADDSLRHLNALSLRYKPGDLGLDVANGIAQARRDFGTAATKIFQQVDRLTGGRELVPTSQMTREAQALIAMIPESDASRAVVKKIADYPPFVTFEQAQRARTQLNELRYSSNLTPGATKHEYGRLAEAIDRSFLLAQRLTAKDFATPAAKMGPEDEALLKDFGLSTAQPASDAADLAASAKAASKMLATADRFYAEGVQKFNDATINRLVASARAGLPPDPSVIAKTIFQPGQEARVREIRHLIGEDTFRRAAAVHWSENIAGPITAQDGNISGQRLYQKLMQQGDLLDTVYGKQEADRMRNLAQLLSGMDGHMAAEKMQPGLARQLTLDIESAKEDVDTFMKENFLSALANPRQTPEDAIRWITQPGQTARLEEALKFFGETSPQIQGVREVALRQLLDNTITEATKGKGGAALLNVLSQYTERQQRILFPSGLDEDLRLLGKEMDFLFPPEADPSMAGFTTGQIQQKRFLTRNWIVGKSVLLRAILTQPSMIRALSIGLRGTGPVREATRHTVQQMAYFAAIEMGDDDDRGRQVSPGNVPGGVGAAAVPGAAGNTGGPAPNGGPAQPVAIPNP